MNSFEKKLCSWHGCGKLATHTSKHSNRDPLCDFHYKGGMFGTGTSFDTYSMIEEDFLNIVKIIPLEKESLNIFSPKLSDIILRVGSNIDIFFNEWIKVPEFNDSTLVKKVRKKRNKTIKDYYNIFFSRLELNNAFVSVRHIEANIYPFKNWTINSSPSWWGAYNKIKHNGFAERKYGTLENALMALGALLILHCKNIESLFYLGPFCLSPYDEKIDDVMKSISYIKTPLDTKRYLFKAEVYYATSSCHDP